MLVGQHLDVGVVVGVAVVDAVDLPVAPLVGLVLEGVELDHRPVLRRSDARHQQVALTLVHPIGEIDQGGLAAVQVASSGRGADSQQITQSGEDAGVGLVGVGLDAQGEASAHGG